MTLRDFRPAVSSNAYVSTSCVFSQPRTRTGITPRQTLFSPAVVAATDSVHSLLVDCLWSLASFSPLSTLTSHFVCSVHLSADAITRDALRHIQQLYTKVRLWTVLRYMPLYQTFVAQPLSYRQSSLSFTSICLNLSYLHIRCGSEQASQPFFALTTLIALFTIKPSWKWRKSVAFVTFFSFLHTFFALTVLQFYTISHIRPKLVIH